MKESLLLKLQRMVEYREEIGGELASPELAGDPDRLRQLTQEYSRLQPMVERFLSYQSTSQQISDLKKMDSGGDPELQELAIRELEELQNGLKSLENELRAWLVPVDPLDSANVFLEIRAGTGGHEAALFVGDLFGMYLRYAESKGWLMEVLSSSHGEHGGYKEIICRVVGDRAYSQLKFESGVHRVQRVPVTEAQGRIHTSAATVAVLPEVEAAQVAEIVPSDLRIDTYRSSGAGGQHVNKTDSAVRITHIPTGVVVECQDERSQHKNRARAMSLLASRLLDRERTRQQASEAATRKKLVGSGDRSERIRTYNYPQGRVTDHRINLTLYQLDNIIQGELDPVIQPLLNEYQASLLVESGDDS